MKPVAAVQDMITIFPLEPTQFKSSLHHLILWVLWYIAPCASLKHQYVIVPIIAISRNLATRAFYSVPSENWKSC